MLVSRSTDSGRTWSNPSTLIRDGCSFLQRQEHDHRRPDRSELCLRRLGSTRCQRRWPVIFCAHDRRRQYLGSRALDLRSRPEQPDDRQRHRGAAERNADQSVHAAGRRCGRSDHRDAQHIAIERQGRKLERADSKSPICSSIGARDPETGTLVRDGAGLGQIAVAPNGNLFVIWQDARFSGGARDGIALSRSIDGGVTWSAPVQINSAPAAQAFTPSVHVRANGTIGVTYYDFRSNTADPATLPTELIFARSTDGVTWQENRLTAAFDMLTAPFSRGLFIGDYHALTSANNVFIPVYVRTNSGDTANRTDVFAVPMRSLPLAAALGALARFVRRHRLLQRPTQSFDNECTKTSCGRWSDEFRVGRSGSAPLARYRRGDLRLYTSILFFAEPAMDTIDARRGTVRSRIEKLRRAMQRHGVAAVVVPSSDPHLSEYLPERWQGREWLSGFHRFGRNAGGDRRFRGRMGR